MRMPLGRRVAAYAVSLGVLLIIAALWLWVVRELKTPLSSTGGSSTSDRPSTGECARFINELKRAPANQRATPETRDRLRQCLEGR